MDEKYRLYEETAGWETYCFPYPKNEPVCELDGPEPIPKPLIPLAR